MQQICKGLQTVSLGRCLSNGIIMLVDANGFKAILRKTID